MIDVGPTFEAKWTGRCPWCDRLWKRGSKIAYVDSVVSCDVCAEDAREANEYERYFGNERT